MPTSDKVPHVWPLAINGTEYQLDDAPSVYEDRSIPTLRNVATGGTADETTLNPEAGFLRSWTSFKRGAGQTFYDRDDSDDQRFRDSWHVNVFDDESVLQPTLVVEKIAATITVAAEPHIVEMNGSVYVAEAANIHKASAPTTTSPTVTNVATGGATINGLVAVPDSYLLAQSSTEIWYVDGSLAGLADRSPATMSNMNNLVYAHGVFLTSGTVGGVTGIYELSGDPTSGALTSSLVHALTSVGVTRTVAGICKADGGFYYADSQNEIHYISVDSAGTLAYEGVRAQTPPTENIVALHEYLGFIFAISDSIATPGIRLFTQGTAGALSVGSLLGDFTPTGGLSGRDSSVYVTVDTSETANRMDSDVVPIGVARLDLTQIADGLVPAWAYAEMFDGDTDGFTASAVTVAAHRSLDRDWIWFASEDHVFRTRHAGLGSHLDSDGWLSTGWVSWGVGDDKLLREVTIDGDNLAVAVADTDDVDAYTTYTNGNEVSDKMLDLRIDVSTSAADLRRMTARAFPLTTPAREVDLPILLANEVTDLQGNIHDRDPRAQRDALVALEGTVVDLQEGQATSVRALVTGHRFIGVDRQERGDYGGTLILSAKLL